jgi:hypothetical protein
MMVYYHLHNNCYATQFISLPLSPTLPRPGFDNRGRGLFCLADYLPDRRFNALNADQGHERHG